ncbi:MAG: hypothetical protein ACE5HL_09020 [Terriglobia bacterium]
MSLAQFYWECLRRAGRAAWGTTGKIALAIALVGGAIAYFAPQFSGLMSILVWAIPLAVFLAVFFIGLVQAPHSIYEEADREREVLRSQLAQIPKGGPAATEVHVQLRQERMAKLASFMNQGGEIRGSAPRVGASSAAVETWINADRNWLLATRAFLSKECAAQAEAKFLDDAHVPDVVYPGVAQEAQQWLRTLSHRLENLSKIMDKPDTYL